MAVPPIVHAQHRVVRRLRDAGATAPAAAQAIAEGRAIDGRALRKLMEAGVVRDVGGGRFYLDSAAYQAFSRERRKRALIAISVVLFVVLVIAFSGIGR